MTNDTRIAVTCPGCSGKFKVKEVAAGKTVKCSSCGQAIEVPKQEPWTDDNFDLNEILGTNEPSRLPLAEESLVADNEYARTTSAVDRIPLQASKKLQKIYLGPNDRNFSTLHFLVWLCKTVAWVIAGLYLLQAILSVVALVLMPPSTESLVPQLIGLLAVQTLFGTLVGLAILTLYVYAEIIMLALQVEKNTFQASINR